MENIQNEKEIKQKKGKKDSDDEEIEVKRRENNFTIPSWAKGIEMEFDFGYDVVNFKNYFTWKAKLKQRNLGEAQ